MHVSREDPCVVMVMYVAGERKLVGKTKLHFLGVCIMVLLNIQSDWMSNTSSGLCIIY